MAAGHDSQERDREEEARAGRARATGLSRCSLIPAAAGAGRPARRVTAPHAAGAPARSRTWE
jgi:hypothetical protein